MGQNIKFNIQGEYDEPLQLGRDSGLVCGLGVIFYWSSEPIQEAPVLFCSLEFGRPLLHAVTISRIWYPY